MKVGSVTIPLVTPEKPEKVVDFLTTATDSEVGRAAYQLIYEFVRVYNRQFAAQLTYLNQAVTRLTGMVEELQSQNRELTNLQQFPVLTTTPEEALTELQQSLNGGEGSPLHLMEWISQHRQDSGETMTPWRDVAKGELLLLFSFLCFFSN